jgi:hypothetical protein
LAIRVFVLNAARAGTPAFASEVLYKAHSVASTRPWRWRTRVYSFCFSPLGDALHYDAPHYFAIGHRLPISPAGDEAGHEAGDRLAPCDYAMCD